MAKSGGGGGRNAVGRGEGEQPKVKGQAPPLPVNADLARENNRAYEEGKLKQS